MKLRFIAIISLLLLSLSSCNSGSNNENTDVVNFTVLQLNDVYEIAPVEGGKYGGMARVATLKKQLLAQNSNLITILAGDFLSPSLMGTLKQDGQKIAGKQMVECMNALGIDYVTFGNHEFDISRTDLQKRINESAFTWLSGNTFLIENQDTLPFYKQTEGQQVPLKATAVHTLNLANGKTLTIGLAGVTIPFNKKDYVHYTDVTQSVRNTFANLQPISDVQLLLSHLNRADDIEVAQTAPGYALVMGGHDHTNSIDTVGGNYVTKADANAKSVYIHHISYNTATKTTTVKSTLQTIDDSIAEDADVKAIVNRWSDIANQSISQMGYNAQTVVCTTTEILDGRESSIRHHPTNYGNIIVSAIAYGIPEADVAILNSGSVRLDDQLTGTILEYDILRSLPYGGPLVMAELKGSVLIQTLETGTTTNLGIGGYLQVAGAQKQNGQWKLGDKKIKKNKKYKVAGPQFLMAGNESNLSFLSQYTYKTPTTLGPQNTKNDVRDILIDYMNISIGQ